MDILIHNTSDHICEVRGNGIEGSLVLLPGVDNFVNKKTWAAAKKTKFVKKRLGGELIEVGTSSAEEPEAGVEM